jgi:hypothetical protein
MTDLSLTRLLQLLIVLFSACAAGAQTNAPEVAPIISLEPARPQTLNRIGISYLMGINVSVDFRQLGGLQLSDPGPATGGTVNRFYDNGYNRVDISGNAGGQTWFWGYSSPNSVQGNNLVLQSDATPATAHSGMYQDHPQSGVELTYSRELTRGKKWRMGVEGAFGYMFLSFHDTQTVNYFVNRTSDSFALNGVIPPEPPYNGTFQGPGAVIGSEPGNRTITSISGAATIAGDRRLDANIFTLRLGPYFELPISRKFSVMLDGGLTLGYAQSTFSFEETVLISDPLYGINLNSGARYGSGSQTDFLVGGYAGANLGYAISERVRLVAGAMFQSTGRTFNDREGKSSVLDLGRSVIFSIGATYSF